MSNTAILQHECTATAPPPPTKESPTTARKRNDHLIPIEPIPLPPNCKQNKKHKVSNKNRSCREKI